MIDRGRHLTAVMIELREDDRESEGPPVKPIMFPGSGVGHGSRPMKHPLEQAVDRMLEADRTSRTSGLLVKVRSMCTEVPIDDLRTAIEVHRANCQPDCSVLAVMEEVAAGGGAVAPRAQSHRVEFRLSMPSRASWDGGWSGEGKHYAVVRELSDEDLARLFDRTPGGADLVECRRSWTHRWSDGWVAEVSARIMPAGEELAKSDGFHSYEWMIDNLLRTGSPYSEVTS